MNFSAGKNLAYDAVGFPRIRASKVHGAEVDCGLEIAVEEDNDDGKEKDFSNAVGMHVDLSVPTNVSNIQLR